MGSALTIANRDLRSSFSSTRGVAVFWFFLLIMGFFFQNFIGMYVEMSARAPAMGGSAPTLDQLIRALFYNTHFILLLIVPAVTMATFSEEKRSQAIRLLQTSPVSSLQIVLGKFFAASGLMFCVLFASLVYPLFLIKYGNPDLAVLGSSYLGTFLVISAQVSFGVWISSMTSNQFLAFLFTMFGLFMLFILNWMVSKLTAGGVMEVALKYLAFSDHYESFLKGVISVADVAYFLSFTGLFLFLTHVVLDSQRWR